MDSTSFKFAEWYKQRTRVDITDKQKKLIGEKRLTNRHNLLMQKRQINLTSSEEDLVEEKKPTARELKLIALKEWKAKRKQEALEKKRKEKPIFKVYHISTEIGKPNLEYVNKTIKGKRFDVKKTKKQDKKSPLKPVLTTMGFQVGVIGKEFHDSPGIATRLRSKNKTVLSTSQNVTKDKSKVKKVKQINKPETLPKKIDGNTNRINKIKRKSKKHSPVKNIIEEYSSPQKQLISKPEVLPEEVDGSKNSIKKNKRKSRKQSPLKDIVDVHSSPEKKLIIKPEVLPEEVDGNKYSTKKNKRKSKKQLPLKDTVDEYSSPEKKLIIKSEILPQKVDESTNKTKKNKRKSKKQSPVKDIKEEYSFSEENLSDKPEILPQEVDGNKNSTKKNKRKIKKQSPVKDIVDEYSSPEKKPTQVQNDSMLTPQAREELASTYISPFVTITRGKTSARKEYKIRISQGGLFDVSMKLAEATGSQAGAAHFYQLLDEQIARIEGICDEWLKYKDEKNPPEEACDMINTAIGQSKLLLSKKFQQFRSLIVDCETNISERPVTCSDLHGYWEMMYLQVENLDKRFENLDNLRNNNWIEILPVTKKVERKKKEKVTKKSSKPKAQSTLRDLIKAKRLKAKEQTNDENVPPSPSQTNENLKLNSEPDVCNKSHVTPLINQEVKSCKSSPGMAMLNASSIGKRGNVYSADSTPARSILKTPHTKSKKKKLVLFRTNAIDIESPPVFNVSSSPERKSKSDRKVIRRSSRVSRNKSFAA